MGGDVGLVFLQEDFCTQFETFETIVDLYVDFGVYDGVNPIPTGGGGQSDPQHYISTYKTQTAYT